MRITDASIVADDYGRSDAEGPRLKMTVEIPVSQLRRSTPDEILDGIRRMAVFHLNGAYSHLGLPQRAEHRYHERREAVATEARIRELEALALRHEIAYQTLQELFLAMYGPKETTP